MLSKFYKNIQLDNNYAIFNTLYFDPVFVSDKELSNIKRNKASEVLEKALWEKHIYSSKEDDLERLKNIQKCDLDTSGQIDTIYLVLTQNCNLRCKYCMVKKGNYVNEAMSQEIAYHAIDLFVTHLNDRKANQGKIVLYGGEPLLEEKLFISIIEYTRKFDIRFSIDVITNGTHISKRLLDCIKENHISVGISLDGPQLINDSNRVYQDGTGSYQDVISTIDLLKKNNIEFGISLCVSPALVKQKGIVFDWIKNNNFSPFYNFNLYHYNSKNENWEKETSDMVDFIISFYDFCLENNIFENKLSRRINAIYTGEPVFSECGANGENQLSIFPQGYVGVCHVDRSLKQQLLNIKEYSSLTPIIESAGFKEWRHNTCFQTKQCLSCEALFICGGGCLLQKKILGFKNVDETFCVYAKKMVKWLLSLKRRTVF